MRTFNQRNQIQNTFSDKKMVVRSKDNCTMINVDVLVKNNDNKVITYNFDITFSILVTKQKKSRIVRTKTKSLTHICGKILTL